MAEVGKYNGVSIVRREEDGSLTEITKPGEPWFLVRAQDAFAVESVRGYASLLRAASDALKALDGDEVEVTRLLDGGGQVDNLANRILIWQANHPDAVKIPD